jgi:hypothetical protein
MRNRASVARATMGILGGVVLLSVAGVAVADEVADDDVEVTVEIAPTEPVGALTMSVAQNTAALVEDTDAGEAGIRVFEGQLPTVTVSDDRSQVPEGVFWYVTGQSSSFTAPGVLESIGADKLGWMPRLLTEDDGEVTPGDEVVTSLDEPTQGSGESANNVGLIAEELLALSADSLSARPQGEWQAAADLVLKTPVDVAPGSYSATLTLTLWEDAF